MWLRASIRRRTSSISATAACCRTCCGSCCGGRGKCLSVFGFQVVIPEKRELCVGNYVALDSERDRKVWNVRRCFSGRRKPSLYLSSEFLLSVQESTDRLP